MNIKQLSLAAAVSALTFTTVTNAVLGPIPIYLNTEYRTDTPVIGSIASTLTFDAEDIALTGANTFLDFLGTVPSVGLYDASGNVPAIFMRGGNSNHTLILVDGMRVNGPESSNGAVEYGLTSIALNDIEKVEIIKGSGSVLYGSSATAGVISITTKKGANGTDATISTKFGTNNSKSYALSASGGSKDAFVRFTFNKYTTDGINAKINDLTADKDSISNHSTQIKVGNEYFNASYLESRNKTEYDGVYVSATDTNNPSGLSDRKLAKLSANINKKFSDTWKAKLSIVQTKTGRNTGVNATTIGDKYKSIGITILNDIKIDDALINVGFSQINDENVTNSNNLDNKLSNKDVFVNWQKNIDSIDINIGTRYIKHSKFSNETVYNLGAAKYFDNDIKLTGTYGTTFNAPSMIQLSAPPYWGANPDLKPETSKNIELGAEKQHDWGVTEIKVYKNEIKDAFLSDTTTGFNWTNNGGLNTRGVELLVNANISGYNVDFSHDYNKSRLKDALTQSIRRPQNTTNLTINKQHGKFNSRAQLIKKSSSIDGGNELGGYTLLNLATNYGINDNAKVSLNIKNVADKDYTIVNGYNQLGRTVSLGITYKF